MQLTTTPGIQERAVVRPTEAEWASLVPGPTAQPLVDVIMPVYRGVTETLRALYSVLAAPQGTPYRLVVIDDCSPEAELSQALQNLAARGLIDLYRNEHNRGFVHTCNRGMSLHPERDVVLLNADVEVYGDWLDRLRASVLRDARIGTVTPLSNNAEICSYPRFVQDNWLELEVDGAALDRLAAEANSGWICDLPTGVGFCMYIRRQCLEEVGLLDVSAFGRGYGEENDLCCRAAARGWRNILAGDVFVRHHGGTSFGPEKQEMVRHAMDTLRRLHPTYLASVEKFIRRDPPRPARRALDAARLMRRSRGRAILFVLHTMGGGTERHARHMAELLEKAGTPVFFTRPDPASDSLYIEDPATAETPNLSGFRFDTDLDEYATTLRAVGVRLLHIHNMAGMPERAADFFRHAARLAGIPHDITLHDYGAICPRITLIDRSEVYCGEPDLHICRNCITHDGSPNGRPDIEAWRASHEALLRSSRRIFVPNADVARRMRRHIPDVQYLVRLHPETPSAQPLHPTPRQQGDHGIRRVAILGAIGLHKGSGLLERVAERVQEEHLPLKFVVVGYTDRDARLRARGVEITGPYATEAASEMLEQARADLVWLPSVCPETFSYTLTVALRQRLFPVVFDLGAQAERLQRLGWGACLPMEMMLAPAACASALLSLQITSAPPTEEPYVAYPDPLRSYYGLESSPPVGPAQLHKGSRGQAALPTARRGHIRNSDKPAQQDRPSVVHDGG